MKKLARPLLATVGILMVLLAASFTFQLANAPEDKWNPSVNNLRPSGVAAFADLLKREGYHVDLNHDSIPKLNSDQAVE